MDVVRLYWFPETTGLVYVAGQWRAYPGKAPGILKVVLVLMTTGTVGMTMGNLIGTGVSGFHYFNGEFQCPTRKGMIGVYIHIEFTDFNNGCRCCALLRVDTDNLAYSVFTPLG